MTTNLEERQVQDLHRTAGPPARVGMAGGFLVLAGLYLTLSPWVIQTIAEIGLAASNTVAGLVLVFLAVSCVRSFTRLHGLTWTLPVIGAWIVASPWVIYHRPGLFPVDVAAMPPLATSTWLSNVIAGAVVVFAGLALAAPARRRA